MGALWGLVELQDTSVGCPHGKIIIATQPLYALELQHGDPCWNPS